MKFVIRQNPKEYTIRGLGCRKTGNGDHQLNWKYNRASHFLIIVYPVKASWNPDENMISWLEENGKELLENHSIMTGGVLWYLIEEQDFLAQKSKFMIPRGSLKSEIPYRIIIYPCQAGQEEWEIYQVSNNENEAVIPVLIPVELRYKNINKYFILPQQRLCMFRPIFDINQLEGILFYKPSCRRRHFPVSVESMRSAKDGWLRVWIPYGEELNIYAALEYKKYYYVRIEEQ